MASQQERLARKIEALGQRILKDYAALQPKIGLLAFERDDWHVDGTVRPPAPPYTSGILVLSGPGVFIGDAGWSEPATVIASKAVAMSQIGDYIQREIERRMAEFTPTQLRYAADAEQLREIEAQRMYAKQALLTTAAAMAFAKAAYKA